MNWSAPTNENSGSGEKSGGTGKNERDRFGKHGNMCAAECVRCAPDSKRQCGNRSVLKAADAEREKKVS